MIRPLATITCRILLVAALLHGPTGAAFAAEPDEGNSEPLHHRHHVAVFLGGGVRDEDHTESGFVAGLDYEYRLTHLFGAGLLAEVATGDLRDVIVAFPFALYPWRGLRFVAAPGLEIPDHGDVESRCAWGPDTTFRLETSRSALNSMSTWSTASRPM